MNHRPLTEFEQETGLDFDCKELLREAFVHTSFANESPADGPTPAHNERLEFLGDAVLEFVVSRYLFARFPDLREGELTRLRAALVRRDSLARVARSKNMGQFLVLGKGEDESGGRTRSATLCATYEAVIGALYLDQGVDAVEEFVMPDLTPVLEAVSGRALGKDAKSRLQEWTQAQVGAAPRYKVVDSAGPDHDKEFLIEATVLGHRCGVGRGRSKQEASQAAANRALVALGQSPVLDLPSDAALEKEWPVADDVREVIRAEHASAR